MRKAALLAALFFLCFVLLSRRSATTTATATPQAQPERRDVLSETISLRGAGDWRSWHVELKEPVTMEVKIDSAAPVDVLLSDVPASPTLMSTGFSDLPCSRSAVLSATIRCEIPAEYLDRTLIVRDSRTQAGAAAGALVGALTRDREAIKSATDSNRVRVSWSVISGAASN